jgi:hypothetical protein
MNRWAITLLMCLLFAGRLPYVQPQPTPGIQAYAEAQPTFNYIEKDAGGQKVGEAHLKGHFEAAARLFLELAGAFFVDLDSPWWSPVGDDHWEWPFGSVVYPIGDEMGVGADVDWLVGSPEVPELTFSPVKFEPDKFLSDMTKDPDNLGEKGKGGDEKKDGAWTDEGGGSKEAQTTDPKADPKKENAPKEDLTKLDDNTKYMRALDEVGKIGDAAKGKGLGKGILSKKLKAIKAKYALQTIEMIDAKDESVKVLVRQKDKDNSTNPIEIKLLGKAELDKEFAEAVADLELKLKMFGDPKTGAVTKAQAETAANETDLHFEVIDGVHVEVDGDHVVIKGDAGGAAPKKMASKPLAKGMGDEAEGGETSLTAKNGDDIVKSEADVTDADRKLHKEIADEIIADLKSYPAKNKDKSKVDTYTGLTVLSSDLKGKNQKKIRKGINLDIALDQFKNAEDHDINVKVSIVPNSTYVSGTLNITQPEHDALDQRAKDRGINLDEKDINPRGLGPDKALLNKSGKSLAKKEKFEAIAAKWEDKFGGVAHHDKRSQEVAKQACDWVITYIEGTLGKYDSKSAAWETELKKFGSDSKKWTGTVGVAAMDIKNAMNRGGVGVKLQHFDGFYRKVFLPEVIKDAVDPEASIARIKAHKVDPSDAMKNQVNSIHGGGAANHYGRLDMSGDVKTQGHGRDEVAGQSDRSFNEFKNETGVKPTHWESKHVVGSGSGDERLEWEEGAKVWALNERDKWVFAMRELSLPLKAGVSGTTNMLMQDLEAVGAGSSGTHRRLACIGYLLPYHHHSLVEIMAGAAGKGGAPDFTPSHIFYRNIEPFKESTLQKLIGDFPDEIYKKETGEDVKDSTV